MRSLVDRTPSSIKDCYNVFHNISTFIGRLHPLLVHLPIGILLMALLLQYASRRQQFAGLSVAVPFVLLTGVFCALLSCITGLLLSSGGEYDSGTVIFHMWMGIATTLVAALWYSQLKSGKEGLLARYTGPALLGLILITGHLGGSLTHGSDYLSGAFSEDDTPAILPRKVIPDVQQAVAFNDIIQPVLAAKCYNCHGPNRQKGKLRMDREDLLMQGGKDGPVILPGNVRGSEMMKRLLLPLEDEHHMSPKGRRQLTAHEIALLSWWIETGASFTNKVKDLTQTDRIKPVLLALQGDQAQDPGADDTVNSDLPKEPVAAADEQSLARLKGRGATVLPVAQNSHYIEVNFMGDPSINDRDLALLLPLRRQLVSLKLGHTSITDSALSVIAGCERLVRLHLDHTAITDKGLAAITGLSALKYINLVGTAVTGQGVEKLGRLKSLRKVYLYQTRVDRRQWPALQAACKGIQLDSGGYVVPLLPVDTMIAKPQPKKNQ